MDKKEGVQENKKKAFYLICIVIGLVVIVILLNVLYNVLKPKVDYEGLHRDINSYTSQFESIKGVKDIGDGVFHITVKNVYWNLSSKHDKMVFCKSVNTNITYLCQKYKVLSDTEIAGIYYYDEDGINIAEPSSKSFSLESNILY